MRSLKQDNGSVGIADLMAALLIAVIGLALVPTIQESTNSTVNSLGATSAGGGLAKLIPLFYVVVIVAGLVAFIVFKHRDG